MEKKRCKWKRQHSEDSEDNMVSDRTLRYSLDCAGALGKSKECRMRRSSEGMKAHFVDDAHFEILNKSLQRSSSTRTTGTIEEEGANLTDRLHNRSSFKSHSKTFHKHFSEISEMEDLINAFTCALQKEVLYHGKMYVSQQHVCFYSSVLLKETKVQIHKSTIQIIKKKNTARVVPNAICIITNTGEKYLFGSLRNRDACFSVLKSLCPQLQDGSPMSSAENGPELDVDTISSQSSQEDNTDPHRLSVLAQDRKTGSNGSLSSSVSNVSQVEARNISTSWNSTNREGQSSDENTAVPWVTMVTEKIRSLLSVGGTTNVNKLVTVYLILLREFGLKFAIRLEHRRFQEIRISVDAMQSVWKTLNRILNISDVTVLLLLLSSGYIGLRIAALEEQLNTLGATTEYGLQSSYKET